MAFLYADPIVSQSVDGRIVAVDQPLDLETEYLDLVDNLQATGKQFTIIKEAVNCQSLALVISKKPKIIHISAHGALDPNSKEFYLAIEEVANGQEDRFSQARLSKLLGIYSNDISKTANQQNHQIKLAFVSACQSEEIGEIFLKAGIPIVISVNTDLEIMNNVDRDFGTIMDRVCKLFSKHFYRNLLQGLTISDSFNNARTYISVCNEDFDTCCCAHKHKPDCVWYQFYLEDWQAAHELHSQKCPCSQHGVNGRR